MFKQYKKSEVSAHRIVSDCFINIYGNKNEFKLSVTPSYLYYCLLGSLNKYSNVINRSQLLENSLTNC